MKAPHGQRPTDSRNPSPSSTTTKTNIAAQQVLSVTALAQQLKCTLRHSWLSNGRHESVAEHTWRMSLMAILIAPHLKVDCDITTLLKIIIVHDLVEAIAGDVPIFEIIETPDKKAMKNKREAEAIQQIIAKLPQVNATEIESLWHEFECGTSIEAKVAQAIDKLEAQIQHNEASLSTWLDIEKGLMNSLEDFTRCDPFLDTIRLQVVAETTAKLNVRTD